MTRTLAKALGCLCLLALQSFTGALAEGQPEMVRNPVVETTPFNAADESRVIVFFKFSCPICRSYHLALEHWARTLPKQISFQFYPVLEGDGESAQISDESARASMFFWAVERAGTEDERTAFATGAYSLVQDSRAGNNANSWKDAVLNAGVSRQQFNSAIGVERPVWASRVERQMHYQPTGTPTMVICGRWMITPDSTAGNQNMFMQLANGLVSKCMQQQGIAPGADAVQ